MKRKNYLSFILIISLLISAISIPALGAEEDSKGLEQAIVSAKKIITVPDNYTEFTHNLSERETNNGKIRVWSLNWAEKEGKNGFVSASIGEDGYMYEYNKYTGNENSNGLAKITKDQAQITAEEFLGKVIPQYAEKMKEVTNNDNISSGEEYYFTYKEFTNDVPVNFITVNIGVNKYSGEVTNFNGDNPEIKGVEYPSKEGIIESAAAEKAYIDKLGVNLKYYSYYDYKQKKMNIFAGYSLDNNRNSAIDAKTGQAISLFKENRFIDGKGDFAGKANSDNSLIKANEQLTKEETDAVNNLANLISKEKAESIIREGSDIITSDMKIKDESLNRNYINDEYIWSISFENAYGEVDAKTGEIISLHSYNFDNASNSVLSKDQAKNLAENFLKKVAPDKFSQTKYEEVDNPILKIGVVQEGNISSFNYIRQVNGIDFPGNSLRIEVDKTKGKVVGYDNNWYNNVSFPDVSAAIGKEAAFNKIKDIAEFSLQYAMTDKNKIGLVYNFSSLNDDYIIDPISGSRLDYTGQVYKDNKLPEYTDISGHWCEKTVKELLDNGYYIEGDKFNPDMNITQINFFKYIYSATANNLSDEELYNMLIQNGVIKEDEKDPKSFVTNQDAAKFVVRYLGYDKIAEHSEIFINPFKDDVQEQYKGYAAMCYGLNIIKGDKSGNFNGTRNITNAQAATIIYNLIKNNTK
ncbi:YcdB/YcdC domain-containing protein [Clostridium sp.]|uniref:YcdB/YcdC domain-containing protein n=1 Tax=Clostridium sp. TaxID=1506 RepID=UPI0026025C47|nr:YcdB/YcdC domain-containing protein [Clostridium sp.]